MADTATTTSSDVPENETPNQRQARLRREKRNAKMAATGEERLAKIKGLNGGIAPPDEALGGPVVAPASSAPKAATVADDPDEVDISDHPYTSKNASQSGTPRQGGAAQADPLQQAMMQMQAQQAQQAQAGGEEDPMAKMMQQLMGMQGGMDPNDPNAMGGDLPQMAQMLSTMMGGGGLMGGGAGQQPSNGSAYLWRIVHAISALVIAIYIAFTTTFSGSKLARTGDMFVQDASYGLGAKPFYIFGTAELVLQTSRYFMEKGQLQGGGILATIANSGFVPEPYAQLIRTVGRYSTIYTTIVSDAMVVVFVLGTVAWWKGLAAA